MFIPDNSLIIKSPFIFFISILVISPCQEITVEELGIKSWPIWTCDVSSFDWAYEEKETCLLIDGEVTVTLEGGKPVHFSDGKSYFLSMNEL